MAFLVEHPKTVREYETVYILRADVLDEDRKKVTDRMTSIVECLDGTILLQEEWGKRKLAYKIMKNAYGIYFYMRYLGYNDMVAEIERNLRILEPVIKYMTVKLGDDVDAEKCKENASKLSSAAPKENADYSNLECDEVDLDELGDED